jgi:hypothetical protein
MMTADLCEAELPILIAFGLVRSASQILIAFGLVRSASQILIAFTIWAK